VVLCGHVQPFALRVGATCSRDAVIAPLVDGGMYVRVSVADPLGLGCRRARASVCAQWTAHARWAVAPRKNGRDREVQRHQVLPPLQIQQETRRRDYTDQQWSSRPESLHFDATRSICRPAYSHDTRDPDVHHFLSWCRAQRRLGRAEVPSPTPIPCMLLRTPAGNRSGSTMSQQAKDIYRGLHGFLFYPNLFLPSF
jgi:hypothetical protein